MHYFILSPQAGGGWMLDAAETRHCMQVLRHGVGDIIHAVDGMGLRYRVQLGQPGKTGTPVQVLESQTDPHEVYGRVELAFAVLKHTDRLSWLAEKATELGATALHPLLTERCERKTLDAERLQRVMAAAMKQCGRSRMPLLYPLKSLKQWLQAAHELPMQRFIPHLEATEDLQVHAAAITTQDVLFIIGPEGDFSPQEVALAQQQGCKPLLLGNHRMRGETAAIYVLSAIKSLKAY